MVQSLSHQGYRYVYRRAGDWESGRTPTFFLSGAFQRMESWRKFEETYCSRGCPVLLADLPGAGQADVLPEAYGVEFLSEALGKVLDACRLSRVHLLAASYATPIAYHYMERHPDRIGRTVLAGTMKEIPDHQRPAVEESLRLLEEGDMDRFATHGVSAMLCHDAETLIGRRKLAQRVLYKSMFSMNAHSRRQYATNTRRLLRERSIDLRTTHRVPTLVFTGEHDVFTLPGLCREVATSLRRSWFTLVRAADHLFHLQQFQAAAELTYRFLVHGEPNKEPLGRSTTGVYPLEFTGRSAEGAFAQPPEGASRDLA